MDNSIIETVKREADIVSVVSRYTELRRSRGSNYVGLCPLHADRSVGSFVVNAARNYCSCWACGETAMDPFAFVMKVEKCDFMTAVKKVKEIMNLSPSGDVLRKEHPAEDTRQTIFLPYSLVEASVKNRERSSLVRWLRTLNWNAEQLSRLDRTLNDYRLASFSTRNHDEFTCFWLIDADGKVRSGKLMTYKGDGHRDHNAYPYRVNGKTNYHSQDFVHAQFRDTYPDDKYKFSPCLYGEHLIRQYPESRINVVESEKSAVISAVFFGHPDKNVWVATGGKSNLRRHLPFLKQLDRSVYIYPDKDGVKEWETNVQALARDSKVRINYDFINRYWTEADGKKADIADVLTRFL